MYVVHRAERADALVDGLRDLLAEPPADPFAPEVVAVHTRGMERWLSQRLSERLGASAGDVDGVCANVSFPFPVPPDSRRRRRRERDRQRARPVAARASSSGRCSTSSTDHWDDEWLSYLVAYADGFRGDGAEPLGGRRFAAARKAARLFDRYAVLRPEMIQAWSRGEDTDGEEASLDDEFRWQAELWRRLRAEIGEPSPAERLETACARLRDEPAIVDLPQRISLFGLTRLPAGEMRVLEALASGRDVHLFALHPSPALWDRVEEAAPERDDEGRGLERRPAAQPAPALVGKGRARAPADPPFGRARSPTSTIPSELERESLLGRVQADIRADREASGAPPGNEPDSRVALEPGDDSIQIHSCHGRARQVEVLREAILHALEDDPSIEPRDVIVMCPDIESFAPLIQATFGAVEPLPAEEMAGRRPRRRRHGFGSGSRIGRCGRAIRCSG